MGIVIKKKKCKLCEEQQYLYARGMCKTCDAKENPDKHGGTLRTERWVGEKPNIYKDGTHTIATHMIPYNPPRKPRKRIPIKRKPKPKSNYWEEYYLPIIKSRTERIGEMDVFTCEESGEMLYIAPKLIEGQYYPSWCAHILPKEHFKSVATDTDNCLILSGMFSENQAHAEFDSTWEKASKMKVAPKAIAYIESVMDKLTFDEQRRARDILEKLNQ